MSVTERPSPGVSVPALVRPEVRLDDRYTAESGPIVISGIQAVVRLMLDLRRLDDRRGLNTGVFVSGYQGSPLGGLDFELQRSRSHLEAAGVVFQPGVNEELAATAVGGTQLLGELVGRRREGVTGFWYGKNPGFDRAADAIRHSNVSGTAPLGGAVALIGDDPGSKSSTVPSSCEAMCRSLVVPLLAPGTVAEVLTLGLHAVMLSRHAGVWAGVKIVADVADASATIEAGAQLEQIPELPVRGASRPPVMLPPANLDAEHDLLTARLARVDEYARAADLNRVAFEPSRPRFGVMAAGMGYQALLRALDDLGFDRAHCDAAGLRIVQLRMPWPLDQARLRELAGKLETVLVVEDKLPFVESQLKEALYRQPHQPLVIGKADGAGLPLLPVRNTLGADDIARALLRVLPADVVPDGVADRLKPSSVPEPERAAPKRVPTFCSGCPHNISTRASADELVGVGIGCHIMVTLETGQRRGQLLGMPQMGGEGAQWFGLAPFTSDRHFIQNLGDGTFHHSGSLAIRAAVAAKVNITYRLLYNDAVAMTGGQQPAGNLSIPELVRELAAEGVKRVIITTPEPERYRGVSVDRIADVRHRDELERAQRELAAIEGVTVLLHDDRCATEKRRLRKRGALEAPAQRAWINERVCEGCGNCGDVSSCVSVLPVHTPFGRKTRIQQSSCNQDMSCLKGDCPSFLLVTPGSETRRTIPAPPAGLAEPARRVGEEVLIRMPGVGGTGVVTVSAILQMAAHVQGRHTARLEQTGLAQKGGPVVSDLRIGTEPITGQIRASRRSVDVLIGFDLLSAVAPETLAALDPARTVAVLNTGITPTGAMVTDVRSVAPDARALVERVRRATRGREAVALNAEEISERLFGDHMPANMLMIGAAYQHGCLPLAADAIERAIELNGAAVDTNRAAFRWGRAAVTDPAALDAALEAVAPRAPAPAPSAEADAILKDVNVEATVRAELAAFVPELVAYQDADYARRYATEVERVAEVERERAADPNAPIAVAFARGLFKLMAYKDEYEVARLHLDAVERARLVQEFGAGARVAVLLHPPLLRALGLKRKLRLGRGARPLFKLLYRGRRLRGTRLDPFGYASVRRVERSLIGEYRAVVTRGLERLQPDTAALVAELAATPDVLVGYEQIKLANAERMRTRISELLARLEPGDAAPAVELAIIASA
jgi:indolepyruvate ferredoxin oxidoreductase